MATKVRPLTWQRLRAILNAEQVLTYGWRVGTKTNGTTVAIIWFDANRASGKAVKPGKRAWTALLKTLDKHHIAYTSGGSENVIAVQKQRV